MTSSSARRQQDIIDARDSIPDTSTGPLQVGGPQAPAVPAGGGDPEDWLERLQDAAKNPYR